MSVRGYLLDRGRSRLLVDSSSRSRWACSLCALAEAEKAQQIGCSVRVVRLWGIVVPISARSRYVRAQDVGSMVWRSIDLVIGRWALNCRRHRWVMVAMHLGMRVAHSIVRRVLRVRREHAGLVRLGRALMRMLMGMLLRMLLVILLGIRHNSIVGRRTGTNRGQQGLDIIRGGHFCRASYTDDLQNESHSSSRKLLR